MEYSGPRETRARYSPAGTWKERVPDGGTYCTVCTPVGSASLPTWVYQLSSSELVSHAPEAHSRVTFAGRGAPEGSETWTVSDRAGVRERSAPTVWPPRMRISWGAEGVWPSAQAERV